MSVLDRAVVAHIQMLGISVPPSVIDDMVLCNLSGADVHIQTHRERVTYGAGDTLEVADYHDASKCCLVYRGRARTDDGRIRVVDPHRLPAAVIVTPEVAHWLVATGAHMAVYVAQQDGGIHTLRRMQRT